MGAVTEGHDRRGGAARACGERTEWQIDGPRRSSSPAHVSLGQLPSALRTPPPRCIEVKSIPAVRPI